MSINNPISTINRTVWITPQVGHTAAGEVYADGDAGGIATSDSTPTWFTVTYQIPSNYVDDTFELWLVGRGAALDTGSAYCEADVYWAANGADYNDSSDSDNVSLATFGIAIDEVYFNNLSGAEAGIASDDILTIKIERDTTSINDDGGTGYVLGVVIKFDETL